jgi:hypothetical protein
MKTERHIVTSVFLRRSVKTQKTEVNNENNGEFNMQKNTDIAKNGEWWMCESESGRLSPMMKVKTGWAAIVGKDGRPEKDYIQTKPILNPLYKLVKHTC